MKILLLLTGKTDSAPLAALIEGYAARIAHYLPFEIVTIPALKRTKSLPEAQQKEKEGELILRALQPGDCCILLDEKGETCTSPQFAASLEKRMHASVKRLVFVVGGPYGFSPAVYRAAAAQLSLSRMTFSHQIIRLLFAEQLYRALTILHNEPYHHE
jgi:23S rRNA (pseudouridine1915-N3)-methyltransferase